MTSRAKARKLQKESDKRERKSARVNELYHRALADQNKGGVIMPRVVSLDQHVKGKQYEFMQNWAVQTAQRTAPKK